MRVSSTNRRYYTVHMTVYANEIATRVYAELPYCPKTQTNAFEEQTMWTRVLIHVCKTATQLTQSV